MSAALLAALPAACVTSGGGGGGYGGGAEALDQSEWADYGDDGRYWSPEFGVRCDRVEQVCCDAWDEPSPGYTERYFGRGSAARLHSRLESGWLYEGWGGGYAGGRLFSPVRGVTCDRVTRICYDREGPSAGRTRDVFGVRAAQRLQDWGRSSHGRHEPSYIFQPADGVTCDFRTEVCYGASRPNKVYTRRFFGEAAAARVEQELEGGLRDEVGQIFVPRAGVKCDRSVQVCYTATGTNVVYTQRYFGVDAAARLRRDSYCRGDYCWRSQREAEAAAATQSTVAPTAATPSTAAPSTQTSDQATSSSATPVPSRSEQRRLEEEARRTAAEAERAERMARQKEAAAQAAAELEARRAENLARQQAQQAERAAEQAERQLRLEQMRTEKEAQRATQRAAQEQRRAKRRGQAETPDEPETDPEAPAEP